MKNTKNKLSLVVTLLMWLSFAQAQNQYIAWEKLVDANSMLYYQSTSEAVRMLYYKQGENGVSNLHLFDSEKGIKLIQDAYHRYKCGAISKEGNAILVASRHYAGVYDVNAEKWMVKIPFNDTRDGRVKLYPDQGIAVKISQEKKRMFIERIKVTDTAPLVVELKTRNKNSEINFALADDGKTLAYDEYIAHNYFYNVINLETGKRKRITSSIPAGVNLNDIERINWLDTIGWDNVIQQLYVPRRGGKSNAGNTKKVERVRLSAQYNKYGLQKINFLREDGSIIPSYPDSEEQFNLRFAAYFSPMMKNNQGYIYMLIGKPNNTSKLFVTRDLGTELPIALNTEWDEQGNLIYYGEHATSKIIPDFKWNTHVTYVDENKLHWTGKINHNGKWEGLVKMSTQENTRAVYSFTFSNGEPDMTDVMYDENNIHIRGSMDNNLRFQGPGIKKEGKRTAKVIIKDNQIIGCKEFYDEAKKLKITGLLNDQCTPDGVANYHFENINSKQVRVSGKFINGKAEGTFIAYVDGKEYKRGSYRDGRHYSGTDVLTLEGDSKDRNFVNKHADGR